MGTYRAANEKEGDSSHQWRLTNEWLQNDPDHPLELEDSRWFLDGIVLLSTLNTKRLPW